MLKYVDGYKAKTGILVSVVTALLNIWGVPITPAILETIQVLAGALTAYGVYDRVKKVQEEKQKCSCECGTKNNCC